MLGEFYNGSDIKGENMRMNTRAEQMTSQGLDGDHNFMGNDSVYRTWFGVLGRSRDSSCLEESNFKEGLKRLGGESENVLVGRYGHWAVGWIEEIYVRPLTPQAKIAQEITDEIDTYPILNEDDWSKRQIEAHYNWCDKKDHENCEYDD